MNKTITKARAPGYSTGELARLTGVSLENIRYFERIGLLQEPNRKPSGHRVFELSHVARLSFIRHAREMGFSQNDVRALLRLSDGEAASCSEVESIASAHLHVIRDRIDKLKKLEKLLAATVAKCSQGKTPRCPVIEILGKLRHEKNAA